MDMFKEMPWVMWAVIVVVLILGTSDLRINPTLKAQAASQPAAVAQNRDNTRDIMRARAELGIDSYDESYEGYRNSYGQSASAIGGLNNYDEIERIKYGSSRSNQNAGGDSEYLNYFDNDDNAAVAIGKLTYSYIPWGGLIVVMFFIAFGSLLYIILSKAK